MNTRLLVSSCVLLRVLSCVRLYPFVHMSVCRNESGKSPLHKNPGHQVRSVGFKTVFAQDVCLRCNYLGTPDTALYTRHCTYV